MKHTALLILLTIQSLLLQAQVLSGFKITGSLNRFDYGLKWNALIEAGGAVVGEEVELIINVELAKA